MDVARRRAPDDGRHAGTVAVVGGCLGGAVGGGADQAVRGVVAECVGAPGGQVAGGVDLGGRPADRCQAVGGVVFVFRDIVFRDIERMRWWPAASLSSV